MKQILNKKKILWRIIGRVKKIYIYNNKINSNNLK